MVFGSAGECVFGLFPYFEQMTILGAILIRKEGKGGKERKKGRKGRRALLDGQNRAVARENYLVWVIQARQ